MANNPMSSLNEDQAMREFYAKNLASRQRKDLLASGEAQQRAGLGSLASAQAAEIMEGIIPRGEQIAGRRLADIRATGDRQEDSGAGRRLGQTIDSTKDLERRKALLERLQFYSTPQYDKSGILLKAPLDPETSRKMAYGDVDMIYGNNDATNQRPDNITSFVDENGIRNWTNKPKTLSQVPIKNSQEVLMQKTLSQVPVGQTSSNNETSLSKVSTIDENPYINYTNIKPGQGNYASQYWGTSPTGQTARIDFEPPVYPSGLPNPKFLKRTKWRSDIGYPQTKEEHLKYKNALNKLNNLNSGY